MFKGSIEEKYGKVEDVMRLLAGDIRDQRWSGAIECATLLKDLALKIRAQARRKMKK